MAKKVDMNTGKKQATAELYEEGAVNIAKTLCGMFDGTPAEQSKTMLNGVTIALTMLARGVKRCCNVNEQDGIERLILSWLAATDPISGMNFSKYITGLESMKEKEE